jgi:hypothetical protein
MLATSLVCNRLESFLDAFSYIVMNLLTRLSIPEVFTAISRGQHLLQKCTFFLVLGSSVVDPIA